MIYTTFRQWVKGRFLETGEPRKQAYTKDELALIEMGWGYGYDAAVQWQKSQQALQKLHDENERLGLYEQEPVAWMVLGDGEYGEYLPGMHFDSGDNKEYWERRGYELQPLYRAPHPAQQEPVCPECQAGVLYECVACSSNNYPPQRQPLTDEQIEKVYWGATGQSLRPQDNVLAHKFARAIEQAHGIGEEK